MKSFIFIVMSNIHLIFHMIRRHNVTSLHPSPQSSLSLWESPPQLSLSLWERPGEGEKSAYLQNWIA